MDIPSLWDCESFPMHICAAFTACLPVAPSSFLYSFDFVFGHVSQQITSWALLVKDSSMLRHEENLCLLVTYYFVLRVYTMLSCMLTCTHNSFCFMRTPHGSRLLQARVQKECSSHFRDRRRGKLPHPPHLETMLCWLWLQVCQRKERSCQDVIIYPTPETMLCWLWLQVCQRKERSCQDVIVPPHPTPPHLETMPCWVWPQVCQRKERSCQDVIIPPHPTASGDDAMLSVAASVSKEGTQLPGRYYPTPPHPTPPHLETMPCWVWPQVCQRKERSCQDVIIPPHPTHPASGDDAMLTVAASVSKEGTQLPGRYYPTPPHPTASGDDAMLSLSVAASVSKEGTQLPGHYYPTPPHPTSPHLETMLCWVWPQVCQRKERSCQDVIIPPHPPASGDDAMLTVAASVTRIFVSESRGWWLRNCLFLVAKFSFFGCGIVFFLVAEPIRSNCSKSTRRLNLVKKRGFYIFYIRLNLVVND